LHMPITFDFGVAFICIWSLMPIFIVTKQCNFMFCTLGTVRNSYKAKLRQSRTIFAPAGYHILVV
jgi:hypothetical protein